jgi:hypothetical protein
MTDHHQLPPNRFVRVATLHGTFQGTMHLGPIQRVVDDLNVAEKSFLVLDEVDLDATEWNFDDGPVAINKSCVLYVQELGDNARSQDRRFAGHFTRAPVRLRVGPYEVEGFVHVPPGGEAMKRLNQGGHPFLPLTSVTVIGTDTQFESPFLAVNRQHIVAAQATLADGRSDAAPAEDGSVVGDPA